MNKLNLTDTQISLLIETIYYSEASAELQAILSVLREALNREEVE